MSEFTYTKNASPNYNGGSTTPSTPTTPSAPPPPQDDDSSCSPTEDAIADAVRAAFEQTASSHIEYGGLIFRRSDNSYGHTTETGTFNGVDIFSPYSTSQVPSGATVVAGWHTHAYGTFTDQDGYLISGSDYFSPNDYSVAGRRDMYGNPISGWEGLGMGIYSGGGVTAFMLPAGAAGPGSFSYDDRYENTIDITRCGSGS